MSNKSIRLLQIIKIFSNRNKLIPPHACPENAPSQQGRLSVLKGYFPYFDKAHKGNPLVAVGRIPLNASVG